jgi:hypothetical protein
MTTEEAEKISKLINTIVVWDGVVQRMIAARQYDHDRYTSAVRWHNQAADELIEMGINVVKFNGENSAAA